MKLVCAVLVLVACGGKEPAPATPPTNVVATPDAGAPPDATLDTIQATLAKVTEFKNLMCACKDRACAESVAKDLDTWSTAMAQSAISQDATEAQVKQMAELGTAYGECMAKLIPSSP